MNDETAINIAVASVMASALDNDTKQEVIKVLRALEEQQKEIEMYKNLVAKGTERRVEDNKEWFDAQSVLVEENARLREALEGVLKYRHVDDGLKDQLRKVLDSKS